MTLRQRYSVSCPQRCERKYPKIYMTGEYVKSPPSFPCVSLIETDNQVYRNTRDSGCIENHTQSATRSMSTLTKRVVRRLNVNVIILIDSKMEALSFHTNPYEPCSQRGRRNGFTNGGSRYRAIVSKNKTIYRR